MRNAARTSANSFDRVRAAGLALQGVEAATKYDGSPILRVHGCFVAGLAMHASAEPATLVVRATEEDRRCLIEDAPDTYYTTDYYGRHPVVLVRLARLDAAALQDLLSSSRRLALEKARTRRRRPV